MMHLTLIYKASSTINMIEDNFDIEKVIGYDALYEAMLKCRRGTSWKTSVSSFDLNAERKIYELSEELHNETYKPSTPSRFTITSPKRRSICSISFRDRVFQRSLNDNAVYPIMTKSFIYANFACQKNKGTDKAREYLIKCLQSHYHKYGNEGYILQVDIKGYYPNMRHDIVENLFKEKLPPNVYDFVIQILHSQYTDDIGYDAGSQLIQIAGISVLDKMDHMIKEQLHIKGYLRYMDDFLLIHHDLNYLNNCLNVIQEYLSSIGFEINVNKTKIHKLSDEIEFLGFIFSLTETGKVVMNITSENIRRARVHLYRLVRLYKKGMVSYDTVLQSYLSWRAHVSKGDTYHVINRMDEYFNELLMDY